MTREHWGDGPGLEFELAGRTEDPAAINPPEFQPVVGRVIVDYYQAHRLYAEDGTLFFLPAWNASADELVYGGAGEPVPDTEGGREPALSPDGSELAFARSVTGGSRHDIWVVPALP